MVSQSTSAGNADSAHGMDYKRLDRRFNAAVRRNQAALFIERLWPRTVPPLCAGGLFLTASWLGLWNALPPVGRIGGMAAFTLAAAASPLLAKGKSLIVRRRDAIDRMDDRIGNPMRPAHALADRLHPGATDDQKTLWAMHRLRLLKEWSEQFTAAAPDMRLGASRTTAALGIAAAAACTGFIAGPQRLDRLQQAFNWVTPPPPVEAKAWITPPENFADEAFVIDQVTRDAAHGGKALRAHKGSVMTLLVFGEQQAVTLNGKPVATQKTIAPPKNSHEKTTYQYSFALTEGRDTVAVGKTLSWQIEVAPDTAPTAKIDALTPDEKDKNTFDLGYQQKDDYRVTEGHIVITPDTPPEPGAQPLSGAQLPKIPLPR